MPAQSDDVSTGEPPAVGAGRVAGGGAARTARLEGGAARRLEALQAALRVVRAGLLHGLRDGALARALLRLEEVLRAGGAAALRGAAPLRHSAAGVAAEACTAVVRRRRPIQIAMRVTRVKIPARRPRKPGSFAPDIAYGSCVAARDACLWSTGSAVLETLPPLLLQRNGRAGSPEPRLRSPSSRARRGGGQRPWEGTRMVRRRKR